MKRECKGFQMVTWILLIALVISAVPVFEVKTAEAAGGLTFRSEDGLWGCEYIVEDTGETVVAVNEYYGTDRDLVFPEEIDGYELRYIGRPGGWYTVVMDRFDSITIPDSVTGFSEVPFFTNCRTLKFLSLGKNFGKKNPYNVNMIQSAEVYNILTKEYRVSPENEVFTAVDGVLYSKDKKELEIYPALKEDTTYTVPNGTTSINAYAMNELQYLEKLVLPEGLEEIGIYCCKNASIRSVNLPGSLKELDHGIFCESKLESITLPATIQEIGGHVFRGTPLEEVVIPDTVKSIGVSVFAGCDKLKSVKIGSNLSSIGGNSFSGLTSLETFQISEDNAYYKVQNGLLLTKDGSTLVQYLSTGNTDLTLPASVTVLGAYSCYGVPFQEIIIPDTVESIGDEAFENCTEAKKLYIPPSVKKISHGSFWLCSSLESATIDAQIESFEDCFALCDALTELTLSETVTSIYDDIFLMESLTKIYLKSPKAPEIINFYISPGSDNEKRLIEKSSKIWIYVPKNAQGYDELPWSRMHIVYGDTEAGTGTGTEDAKEPGKESGGAKEEGSSAGAATQGTSYEVGSYQYKVTGTSAVSMTKITEKNLTKVTVPKTVQINGKTYKVTSVGNNAFANNKKMTSIEIGDNVSSIGSSAFKNCTKLSKVKLGKGVTTIGSNAFKNCKKLGSITLKSRKLASVEKNAFKGIKAKAKIKVPAGKFKAYKKLLKGKGQGKKVKIVK